MNTLPLEPRDENAQTVDGPEVVGIYEDLYAEPGFANTTVPTTPFPEIVSRGGNNPDGGFKNLNVE